jgi:hypothetical protein
MSATRDDEDEKDKADRDNRANQLNDNNDAYWQSRGGSGRPGNDDDE